MFIKKYLESLPTFELEKYDARQSISDHCIPFTGTPKKHPYDGDKLILVQNPFSSKTLFYEFYLEDIEAVEDVPSLGTETGESMKMVKIWVTKGSRGLRYEPFEVNDPLQYFTDSEVLKQPFGGG